MKVSIALVPGAVIAFIVLVRHALGDAETTAGVAAGVEAVGRGFLRHGGDRASKEAFSRMGEVTNGPVALDWGLGSHPLNLGLTGSVAGRLAGAARKWSAVVPSHGTAMVPPGHYNCHQLDHPIL